MQTKKKITVLHQIMQNTKELPEEILLQIFANLGRESPKYLGNIKIRYLKSISTPISQNKGSMQ
jgi:hypothetical protein